MTREERVRYLGDPRGETCRREDTSKKPPTQGGKGPPRGDIKNLPWNDSADLLAPRGSNRHVPPLGSQLGYPINSIRYCLQGDEIRNPLFCFSPEEGFNTSAIGFYGFRPSRLFHIWLCFGFGCGCGFHLRFFSLGSPVSLHDGSPSCLLPFEPCTVQPEWQSFPTLLEGGKT